MLSQTLDRDLFAEEITLADGYVLKDAEFRIRDGCLLLVGGIGQEDNACPDIIPLSSVELIHSVSAF